LMAGVWRSTTETLPKKSVSQGERSE
jgi:hypothetical protein